MKMTSEEFAETFMEGVRTGASSQPNWEQTTFNLVSILYDTREQVRKLQAMIKEMDDVVIEFPGIFTVECRSCGKDYELPCNLSEFNSDMSYCGGSPRCCP